MGKGDAKKQMDINNKVSADQLAYMKAIAQGYLNYQNKLVANGGYSPGVREALTSTAINQIPQAYAGIARNLQTAAAARGLAGGGALPGGGGYLAGYGNLLSQEEQARANALNNITQQGQQNIMSAESGSIPLAGAFGQTGASALGNATSAANASTQASSGLLGSVIGGGLGVLGSFLGKPSGGG